MAPISPGTQSGPPRKVKKPTATTKAHRYEPFTKRIARLKIDPVHTVQRTPVTENQNDLSQSYFRASLDEWAELNLSETFTSFYRKVNPLSESLPQLLHHADTISDLLAEHIEKKDAVAMEPLLSLAAHFARDLGQTFEKYFASMVKLVAQVSASHDDPAVIEWCFTCLAWLFKYLSRLLVPDLRPLLEIMLPYLAARKDYIRRFTAESLAFLIRKAAMAYTKNPTPLEIALDHLFINLEKEHVEFVEASYEMALMTLISESGIGVDAQLHSSAEPLMKCAFETVVRQPNLHSSKLRVLQGIVINLIHRTDAAGFKPLLQTILLFSNDNLSSSSGVSTSLKLLAVTTGTRKGSRIREWKDVIEVFLKLTDCIAALFNEHSIFRSDVLEICAIIIQYAPMDNLLPFINQVIDCVATDSTSRDFFSFCELSAALGKGRFQDLVLPRLQQYLVAHWGTDEEGCSKLICNLFVKNAIAAQAGSAGFLSLPRDWEHDVILRLENDTNSDGFDIEHASFMALAVDGFFPKGSETKQKWIDVLKKGIFTALSKPLESQKYASRLLMGWAIEVFLTLLPSDSKLFNELWPMLLTQGKAFFQMLPFVKACAKLAGEIHGDISVDSRQDQVIDSLVENMLSDSSELREASLNVLIEISTHDQKTWIVETCDILMEILHIPYNPSTTRQIAMLLRRLPQRQVQASTTSSLFKLVPYFSLGLLHQYHDQTRRDLCSALSSMAAVATTEDLIMAVLSQWLQMPGEVDPKISSSHPSQDPAQLTKFQCSNVLMIERFLHEAFKNYLDPGRDLQARFEKTHTLQLPRTPVESRLLALQVCLEMPEIAEKRSRVLVPAFLSIQRGKTNHHVPSSNESTSTHTLSPEIDDQGWSLKERKSFIELIGKFINPKVLYRNGEVYSTLLEMLTNGNSDIRKLALDAILKWKDLSLQRYADVLQRVAQEKNANTELGLLLSNDDESSSVKPADRQDVLPVLLRLVFGQLIGRSGTHGSQEAKRKAILRFLFRMDKKEVIMFLDIALGRLRDIDMADSSLSGQYLLSQDVLSLDQQYGFLRMMLSMLEILQSQFTPFGEKVVNSILYCTARASHQINILDDTTVAPALVRNTRRTGLQCLVLLFEHCPDLNWNPFTVTIFSELIQPRIDKFASETAQGISVLLKLVSVWCKSIKLAPLLQTGDPRLLGAVWELLSFPTSKNEVKLFVLEQILSPFTQLAGNSDQPCISAIESLQAESPSLLNNLAVLLETSPAKNILFAISSLLPDLAPFASSSESVTRVLNLLIIVMTEPNARIPPHIKGQLLIATESLLRVEKTDLQPTIRSKLYNLVCSFFNYFKDVPNRLTVVRSLYLLVQGNDDFLRVAEICDNLNSISTKHLNEVDYDKRLKAYDDIKTLSYINGTRDQWLPVIYNLLYFARTSDDFAIRSNAVSCLKSFVKEACISQNIALESIVRDLLLPAFKKAFQENSEVVRADFVGLFGMIVKHLNAEPLLQDLKILLVGDDEEASFFTNILHIQQHRRTRAIRRVMTEIEAGSIGSANISDFVLPLLEKFIHDESTDETAQGAKGHSIAAFTVLLQWVEWKVFKRICRQYKQDLSVESKSDKDAIRLLGHAADALARAEELRDAQDVADVKKPHLARTLPDRSIVRQELKTNLISKLTQYSHYKDEAEISLRIPAAVVAIKLINLLAEDEVALLSAPIVLDVGQVLRSRTQEARDTARNTLADIVGILGPSSVQFVLKELRNALTRGYQLHVLSYTLHTILLKLMPTQQPGDLDYCVSDLVAVVMDDIFGAVGQEKENQDYISSMKEVKSSKSLDSMEILAKSTSVRSLSKLVLPIQTILVGSLTTKQLRQIDELLRRVGVGISHSPVASSRDLLVFAYELIQAFYKEKQAPASRIPTTDEKNRQRFLIQLQSSGKSGSASSASLQYKLAKFALDIVRSTVAKHTDLMTAGNIHGFLPIVGDALIEAQEDVKISALRLLSSVIKLPIAEIDQNALLYVMEAVKIVKGSISTNDEASQAALKLVAAVLRERRDVEVREADIAYLLHRTMPDLEEPDRQGVTFNFLKAVLVRGYQLPEVYELVDKIGMMMVTNQSRSARDVARGVYVHFLLDYPQSKSRWQKQLKFLVKNLEYQYPEGRQSVMEAVHTLMQKIGNDMVQELVSTFFIPIVLRMANDEHAPTREMAGVLLAQIYRKADTQRLESLLDPLRSWMAQTENDALVKLSMQALGIFFDTRPIEALTEVPRVRVCITKSLQTSESADNDWELQFQALQLLLKLVSNSPEQMLTSKQANLWSSVRDMLSSPHQWIQSSAASLIGTFFQSCVSSGSVKLPLLTAHGLMMTAEMLAQTMRSSMRILKRNEGNEDLHDKNIQNLLIISKCADESDLTLEVKARVDPAEDVGEADHNDDDLEGEESDTEERVEMRSILATQYLLDQAAVILRREPPKMTSASFMPRKAALELLTGLIPHLSPQKLSTISVQSLLIPLQYITDPNIQTPRSTDPTFAATHTEYVNGAHAVMEAIQTKIGDAEYIKAMTAVTKIVRQRREGRRTKRRIERVAEPERAARDKKRKAERTKERKKEIKNIHRGRRRADLGF